MDSTIGPASDVLFEDGLGVRRQILDQTTQETLEVFCVRAELASEPGFEAALRDRASRLAQFLHPDFRRVRRVGRLTDRDSTLLVVMSDRTPGTRLSDILATAARQEVVLDIGAALAIVRQLVSAVAALHRFGRDVAHGAISPERIIVTPHARLMIVEDVFGAALEGLRYSHERYWNDLRIALPPSAGAPRFDHRADVTQTGAVALALILGRPLDRGQYRARLRDEVNSALAISAREPVMSAMRSWLLRALQIDTRRAFASGPEAEAALDEALSGRAESIPVPRPSPHVDIAPVAASVTSEPEALKTAIARRAARKAGSAAPPATWLHTSDSVRAARLSARARTDSGWWSWHSVAALLMVAVVTGAFLIVESESPFAAFEGKTGTLTVESRPSGVEVAVDGEPRGHTPLSLSLEAGPHLLELGCADRPRTIQVTLGAGMQISQYVELSGCRTR